MVLILPQRFSAVNFNRRVCGVFSQRDAEFIASKDIYLQPNLLKNEERKVGSFI